MVREVLKEQRINIKLLVKLGKGGSEIVQMLNQVYGESAMQRVAIYKWVKRFEEGRDDVEDDPREGRPSTSRVQENVERVKELVLPDRRITVRMIADQLNLSKSSLHNILREELKMRKLCAKIVPKVLSEEQKQRRVFCASDWLSQEDLLDRVITGDESWVYEYDPETKRSSEEWKQQGEPKKARKSRSKIKAMLIVFLTNVELFIKNLFLKARQ